MPSTLARAATLVLVTAALGLGAPALAAASSIVYINGGNVWIAAPDGTQQYQVTTDGSPSDPYSRPSQADDGTIVAVRGNPARLYRLRQNGDQLNAPFTTVSPLGNVVDAEVSPDGRTVAYAFVTVVNGCFPYTCAGTDAAVAYTAADHLQDPGGGLQKSGNWHWVSWIGGGRTLLTDDSNVVYYDDVGGGDDSSAQWFDQCTAGLADCSSSTGPGLHDLHVSRDGRKAAWIWQAADPDPFVVADDPYLQLGATSGDVGSAHPPQAPGLPACNIGPGPKELASAIQWDRPTFAPDGSAVAWAEGDGIHVADATLSDCAHVVASDHLVVAGASQPFWGPADVNPGPRSVPPAPGPTPPPSGGSGSTAPGGGSGSGGRAGTPAGDAPQGLPRPGAIVARQRLRTIARIRVLRVTCRLAAAGRCTITVRISGRDARRLRLTRRHGKTYALGRATVKLSRAGRRTVRVRLSRREAAALRRLRSLRLTVTATATYADGRRSTSRRLTLKR